ncbi:MAG: stage II sporulation protein D [Oscillospiraceae bacterium]|nr:stage II sporulation protein D [Oscillospiraceae bacterium]MCL1952738.1 stage II sporulation protein D [Oscillospiraceae bacterium]
MKQHFIFGMLALLLMILIPLVSLQGKQGAGDREQVTEITASQPATTAASTETAKPAARTEASIPVVRASSGKTETIGAREYLIGCVAAEMDPSSQLEALKAQAVASYTYARYRLELGGRDALSDSGKSDQGYLDAAQRKARWGEDYALDEEKVERAVDAVLGQAVTREGRPVLAAYCAVNAGRTESAENYWGDDLPYLQSVDSPGDKLSPDYSKTVTLQADDVKKALEQAGAKPGKDPAKWFGAPERSEAGTVLELEAGGKAFSGRALREALHLRSANFTIAYKDGAFEIKCLGFGHGVGMSQYGADFMARQGSDYKEILEHYYTGCTVK